MVLNTMNVPRGAHTLTCTKGINCTLHNGGRVCHQSKADSNATAATELVYFSLANDLNAMLASAATITLLCACVTFETTKDYLLHYRLI